MRASEQQTVHEAPSPEQIQAMIDTPSELALRRIEMFSRLSPITAGNNKVASRTPMEAFLKGYYTEPDALGFYDEVVEALHGDDARFTDMLRGAARREPGFIINMPEIFEPLFDESEREELHRRLVRQESWWYYFTETIACCNDREKETFANETVQYASILEATTAAPMLAYATNIGASEKKQAFQQSLKKSRFQSGIQFLAYNSDYYGSSEKRKVCEIIASLKQLEAQEIINASDLEDAICSRLQAAYGLDDNHTYRCMVEVKVVLAANGLLSEKTNQPDAIHDTVIDYCVNCVSKKRKGGNIDGSSIARLVEAGFLREDEAKSIILEYAGDDAAALWADVSERLNCIKNKTMFNYEIHEFRYTEQPDQIKEWHERHVINGEPWHEHIRLESVVCQEPDRLLLQDLLEKWYGSHGMGWLQHSLKNYIETFSDNPDRLRQMIRDNIERGEKVDLGGENWQIAAEFMGYSRETIRELVHRNFVKSDSLYNLVLDLGDSLSSDDPLFTKEECVTLLLQKLPTYELESYDPPAIASFAMTFLGRELTRKYIEPLFSELPELEMAFGMNRGIAVGKIEKNDIYDVYNNSFLLPKLVECLTVEEVDGFITKMAQLPPELISDLIYTAWYEASLQQKEALVARLVKNRALFELTFSRHHMKLLRDLYAPNGIAVLSGSPEQDLLQQTAPKAYATYKRRLAAKERQLLEYQDRYLGPYLDQSETTEARVAAKALLLAHYNRIERGGSSDVESKRADVLTHYAYYYDLCVRLEGFMEGQSIPPSIRGKNEDKNELRALELLVLLHEAGERRYLSDVISTPKEQLEQEALYSSLDHASLSNEEKVVVKEYLHANNIDIVKFGIWLHVSSRSPKVNDYMTMFVKHIATGGDVVSWKKEHGNNTKDLLSSLQDAWLKESSTNVTFGNGNSVTMRFTNDLNALYLCGARPVNNCLHYAYGLNQRALPGLLSSDIKLLLIENSAGNPIGNAVLRLVTKDNKPYITLEPLYTSVHDTHDSQELHRAAIMATEQYASSIGLDLTITTVHGYDQKMKNATKLMWSDTATRQVSVELMKTTAPYSYGDGSGLSSKRVFATVAERLAAV